MVNLEVHYTVYRSCILEYTLSSKLRRRLCGAVATLGVGRYVGFKKKKMNLFGYTYKIYDIGYKTEMMSKECNAGDPLETPGGLYRGPCT